MLALALASLAFLFAIVVAALGGGPAPAERPAATGGGRAAAPRPRSPRPARNPETRPPSPGSRVPGAGVGNGGRPGGAGPGSEAWVTLVMQGDGFVPGALVLAHSLRRAGTRRALVCMVTPDVSQKARAALGLVFDDVPEVGYIEAPTAPLPTAKQKQLYPWIGRAYTKWRCLGLTRWSRIVFVDADMCFAESADELFSLPAPAACFCSAWLDAESPYLAWWRRRHPAAAELPHGARLPPSVLLSALKGPTFTAIAALVRLDPDAGALERFQAFLAERAPYGSQHRVRGSGADETSIVEFTARSGQSWRHIHPRYEAIPRKAGWGEGAGPIKAWHFHGGDKPWRVAPGTWPDLAIWWAEAERARQAHPALAEWLAPKASQ